MQILLIPESPSIQVSQFFPNEDKQTLKSNVNNQVLTHFFSSRSRIPIFTSFSLTFGLLTHSMLLILDLTGCPGIPGTPGEVCQCHYSNDQLDFNTTTTTEMYPWWISSTRASSTLISHKSLKKNNAFQFAASFVFYTTNFHSGKARKAFLSLHTERANRVIGLYLLQAK